jgi:hypothetical protein
MAISRRDNQATACIINFLCEHDSQLTNHNSAADVHWPSVGGNCICAHDSQSLVTHNSAAAVRWPRVGGNCIVCVLALVDAKQQPQPGAVSVDHQHIHVNAWLLWLASFLTYPPQIAVTTYWKGVSFWTIMPMKHRKAQDIMPMPPCRFLE